MIKFLLLILCAIVIVLPGAVTADFKQQVVIKTKTAGNVPFSHENHLKNLNNNCSTCHNSIFHISHKNNPSVTMAEMEKGKSCGACHNKENPKTPQLNQCTTCHAVDVVPITIPDFGTVVFKHSKHLGMFVCTDCHTAIFKADRSNPHVTMAQMQKGKSCGSCHDGSGAFSVKGDCVKCHQVNEIPLAGGSVFSHSAHLEMSFNCTDCHNKIFIPGPNRVSYTMQDMESGKSCGVCHNGKTAFSVKGDCQKCHKNVKDVSFKAFDAKFSHSIHLNMFKCDECHSSIFIGGVRSIRYTMQQMEKGKSCGACHDGKAAFTAAANCEKCHSATPPDHTFNLKNIGTVAFSHTVHRSKYTCSQCHSSIIAAGAAAKRYTMGDMEKGKSCGTCHNGKVAFSVSSCSKCHPVKEVLFSNDAHFSHDKHLAVYTCADCHNQLFIAGPKNKRFTMAQMEKGSSCGSCHDGSSVFSVKGDCDKCHKATLDVVFHLKETGASTFSHSVHREMFKCSECHSKIFRAGKTSTRATMADMEKGQSCGACHNKKTAFGVSSDCQKCHTVRQIKFSPGSAEFSHKVHTALYTCNDCHPKIFIPGPGNKRMSMSQMEKGLSCGSCHDDKTAFSVKSNCVKCHPGTPRSVRYELSPSTGNVEFSHKPHSDKGYACKDCHYTAVPSGSSNKRWIMKELDQGKFCGACHGFSMAFSVKDPISCERCHLKESDWRPQAIQ